MRRLGAYSRHMGDVKWLTLGTRLSQVLGFVAAASLAPLAAYAGANVPGGFSCSVQSDGSGYCTGTHQGARDSAGFYDQASFTMATDGFAYFGAVYSGTSYSCSKIVTAGSLEALTWNAAISSRNYFYVTWDSAGTCEWVYIGNMSAHQNAP